MDLLNVVSAVKPTGMWSSIIFGLENAVGDYALALILITIIIKLVMVPFDFVNRYTSKKSSRKQMEIKPEIDKINAKYANDKNMLNQKTMEVYKSHNFNIMGTCLGMLVYLVFTMVIFWTLFGALNNISTYKIGDQFLQVRNEYYSAYSIDVNAESEKTPYQLLMEKSEEERNSLKSDADKKASEKYNETKAKFLWIENIWLADTTVNPVMEYEDFLKKSGFTAEEITAEEYNLIIEPIKNNESARKSNGYFILAVLAAGLNFLSMSVNTWMSKYRAKKKGVDTKLVSANNNKLMSIIMPVIMGVFTLFYNAAFGLYIVAGALITLITSPLVTLFVDMLEFDAIHKEKNKNLASYDRKRK
ncbi:MAG: YidC/Oxa1 family membrane protein insertase [Clostridiales bacterium]|nr:YidC/Oxa1 family membrane protein insertase [Clostridiales bacterium]